MLDPITKFNKWFKEATDAESTLAEAASLATVSESGQPSCRVVLFKGFSEDKNLLFFTNYNSQKSNDILHNPKVALTIHWKSTGKQIRVEGEAKKTTKDISQKYWATRPRGSQIGALASEQSQPIESRQELLEKARKVQDRVGSEPIKCPENWGGFEIKPHRIEFWQNQEDRLHDRLVYSWSGNAWETQVLAP